MDLQKGPWPRWLFLTVGIHYQINSICNPETFHWNLRKTPAYFRINNELKSYIISFCSRVTYDSQLKYFMALCIDPKVSSSNVVLRTSLGKHTMPNFTGCKTWLTVAIIRSMRPYSSSPNVRHGADSKVLLVQAIGLIQGIYQLGVVTECYQDAIQLSFF